MEAVDSNFAVFWIMLLALAPSSALLQHCLTPLGPRAMEDSGNQLVALLLLLTSPPFRAHLLVPF